MKSLRFLLIFLLLEPFFPQPALGAFAQEAFLGDEAIFQRHDLNLGRRLRQLTLEEVFPSGGREIVILERGGDYPDWKLALSVWSALTLTVKPLLKGEVLLPLDALFYGFVRRNPEAVSDLLLLRTGGVELWPVVNRPDQVTWRLDPRFKLDFDVPFPIAQAGNAEPFDPVFQLDPSSPEKQFLIPSRDGFWLLAATPKGLELRQKFSVPPRAFYKSSSERLAFELPFWLRSSLWHPGFHLGSFSGAKPFDQVLFPWMDEVTLVPASGGQAPKTVYFHQLTEAERDDAQSYVVTTPEDLDGDGRTDFVVNKFKGETTSLRAETHVFMTGKDGKVPEKGLRLTPRGNRAGGALPVDLNLDGKKDLAVASSQFNAWAVVKALVQRQTDVAFAFYYFHPDGFHLDRPDFEREISFKFDLTDLVIDGMLPTLDGDFNGDGYPDALYARDRRALTVLVQKAGTAEPFASVPSGVYEVHVPRLLRIGDLNGDGKSDVVLYDRRSEGNRRVTVLLNTRRLP